MGIWEILNMRIANLGLDFLSGMVINGKQLGAGLTTVVMGMSVCSADGLSTERQAQLIESLQKYQPSQLNQKVVRLTHSSTGEVIEAECDQDASYGHDQHCLEQRFIKGNNYLVRVRYNRDEPTPLQPRTPFIRGSKPLKQDTTARDKFLVEMSEPIAKHYLGENYSSFESVRLLMSKKRIVMLELEITDTSQLDPILADPRISNVYHVASPEPVLEEITN